MADVFDQITTISKSDIFDQIMPEPKKDISDQVQPVTETSPIPYSPEEQFGRILGTVKGKPMPIKPERPFIEEHPTLYGIGKAVETLPQGIKELGEAVVSGATLGLSEQVKRLGEYLSEKITGRPVPEKEKMLPEYLKTAGEFAGAAVPIGAAGKIIATPIIKAVSKSRHLEPFARMLGWGVAGTAYETANKMASEGELPSPEEMAKSGGLWAGIEAILGATGWGGRLAIGVSNLARTWNMPRQEVLKTILAEAKARKMPIARYAYAKAKVQKSLGEKINKSAEQLVDLVETLHEPFVKKGTYQNLIEQLKDEELTSKVKMFKDYAGKGIELGKEIKPSIGLIKEKAPEVRKAFEKPGFLRTAEEKLILHERPEPEIMPKPAIEIVSRPRPMEITPGLRPIERMPLKEPFELRGEGVEVSMPRGATEEGGITLGFGPAGELQKLYEKIAKGFKNTQEAIDFGLQYKENKEVVTALREGEKIFGLQSTRALKAKNFQEALDLGVKSQFYREAADATEGKLTHEGYVKGFEGVPKPKPESVTLGFGPVSELQKLYEKIKTRPKEKIAPIEPAVIDPVVKKVINTLKGAKVTRKVQEALYSRERGRRLGKALTAGERIPGEKGFHAQLRELKGELPKAQFESIREKFDQSDIDHLFNVIRKHTGLIGFEKIEAQKGLAKLFGEYGGTVPGESEINLLNKIYGTDFTKAILEKRPLIDKMKEAGLQIANIPRSLMSSFLDLSFGFRQGVFAAPHYRKEFARSFKEQFKYFASENTFKASQEEIEKRATYKLMRRCKLALTEMDASLSLREERYQSQWAEKIPILGKGVRATSRAYAGFANKLRADMFDRMVKEAENIGLNPSQDIELGKSIAKFVNNATGRGSLGSLEKSAVALNAFFFSPRLMASRLSLLNPVYYLKQPKFVRKEALKSLFGFAGSAMTILTAMKAAGADIETDPRSADFAKIKIGNTRIDILGGFQQYIRLAAQLVSGKIKSSTTGRVLTLGEGYKPLTRLDVLGRAIEYKEAPTFSLATTLLRGKGPMGEEISIEKEIGKRFVPILAQDIYDLAKDDPELLPIGVLGAFGIGIQTYGKERPIRRKRK